MKFVVNIYLKCIVERLFNKNISNLLCSESIFSDKKKTKISWDPMDFRHINDKSDKHRTPKSEMNILSRRISVSIDSPFSSLPCFTTPPSRFAKIINPFEPHLIERLHLPTFSPNVFVQNSTPKTEQKFKWTIEDISSLKPADIDETTVSQHVCTTNDPHIESLVQQKIDTFFSEKEIVPSPMNVQADNVPVLKDCTTVGETPPKAHIKDTCEGATQTVLTLPPVLPKEVEEALKPYFTYHEDQQQSNEDIITNKDASLYRQLFEFENNDPGSGQSHEDVQSLLSSPAISTGLSPLLFSPCSRDFSSPLEMPELRDCNLSPITKNSPKTTRLSRSVCRLDFSTDKMSIDASLIVPDLDNQQMSSKSGFEADNGYSPQRPNDPAHTISTANWSMEYKHISIGSPNSSTDSDRMDVSNSNTPHSKLFTGKGQRKRLSESFKTEEFEDDDNALQYDDLCIQNRSKMSRNDQTEDAGYYTQETADFSNNHTNVFASTPSKRMAKIEF